MYIVVLELIDLNIEHWTPDHGSIMVRS